MSEPNGEVHVEVDIPPASEPEAPAVTETVVVNPPAETGASDGTLTELLRIQRELDELRNENTDLRTRLADAELTAADAASTAQVVSEQTATEVAELAEAVAEAQPEPEPDHAPVRTHWLDKRIFGRS